MESRLQVRVDLGERTVYLCEGTAQVALKGAGFGRRCSTSWGQVCAVGTSVVEETKWVAAGRRWRPRPRSRRDGGEGWALEIGRPIAGASWTRWSTRWPSAATADTEIDEVIERAGVSRLVFTRLFASKEECFVETINDSVRQLVRAVDAAWPPRPLARPGAPRPAGLRRGAGDRPGADAPGDGRGRAGQSRPRRSRSARPTSGSCRTSTRAGSTWRTICPRRPRMRSWAVSR